MKELTKGSPVKLILLFTIPLLIGNIFQQLYATVDMIIVGKTLGKTPLAAVGSTGSLNFLIIGFAVGLTSGLSILTAQRFGAEDFRGVKKSFAVSIVISAIVTVILTILSVLFVHPMLVIMQTPKAIIHDAQNFITIIFLGIFASIAFNLLSNVLRALGDSRTPLVFLIIACVINIALDLFFIIIMDWGVAGAAIATVVAQVLASVCCVIYIYQKIPLLQLRKKDFQLSKQDFVAHARVAFPMAFQTSIIAIGAVVLQGALNSLGTNVVAAQTAAGRIDQFATLPMMSFGVTMATYTAQNYGAKQYLRIIQGVKQGLMLSCSFAVIAGALVILFGKQLVKIFISASEIKVIELAQVYFNINASLYWILAILFILRYTLQGLGQSVVPTIAGIMELIMRCGAAIFLTILLGYPGAAAASPLAWIGSVVVLLASYVKSIQRLKTLEKEKQMKIEMEHKTVG
ncbi:putative efflux protein, MATE family [Pilibacter termitis]|uniref:Probable multidrug resistance protein NorM n=1 Tax=Pilibacter termitis TaxID=263852 RepID=A0A1T4QGP5_9ENTE|nr:MATE family efflux transporter [Pilibacter termitis]SKA02970.1 putative efflux protein, MATE family [Pilibacter termitis]